MSSWWAPVSFLNLALGRGEGRSCQAPSALARRGSDRALRCARQSQQHCTPTPRGGPGSLTCAPPRRSPGATPAHDSDKAHAAQPGNTERVRAAARSTGGCQPPPGHSAAQAARAFRAMSLSPPSYAVVSFT